MTITKKDLMYLKFLALFAGLYVFWTFLWTPMSQNLEAKQIQLADLKFAEEQAKLTIPTYDAVVAQEAKIKGEAAAKFALFFDVKSPAMFEADLIPILKAHNGRILYFEVADASVVIPQSTLQTKEQLTYRLKELVDTYNQVTETVPTIPVTESQLLKTQITYIVELSFADYRALLTTIDSMDIAILLSSANYDIEDENATLVFDLYSVEKIVLPD